MDKDTEQHYKNEIARAQHAQKSYDNFIKPFIHERREVMFDAFQTASVTDQNGIMEIKRQLMVVNALENEILEIIATGKLAAKSLETAAKGDKK